MLPVAFVGLGRMGTPMAGNLAAAGYELILHNRTRSRADALAERRGCRVADSPRTAAAEAGVVITMLADSSALRDVLEGEDGVLAGLSAGGIIIDMGTTGPDAVSGLAAQVSSTGGILIDAPVSGSVAAAEQAGLTIMVGAPDDAFAAVAPLLDVLGSRVFHLGDTGAGATMKLAVNNVIYGLTSALAESLVLAERAGLDREQVYAVFADSAVAAPMVAYRREAFLAPSETPPAFALALAEKDLELITALAASVGLDATQASANLALVRRATAAGLAQRDLADLAVYLREVAGSD